MYRDAHMGSPLRGPSAADRGGKTRLTVMAELFEPDRGEVLGGIRDSDALAGASLRFVFSDL